MPQLNAGGLTRVKRAGKLAAALLKLRGAARAAALGMFGRNQRIREALQRLDFALGIRLPVRVRPLSASSGSLPYGINITGDFSSNCGIAEAARSEISAIGRAGLPFSVSRSGLAGNNGTPSPDGPGPYRYSLVHLNPEHAHRLLVSAGPGYFGGRYNIGVWVWEVPEFPERYSELYGLFDEIWTPSQFSRAIIAKNSPVPVITVPHAVSPEHAPQTGGRERLGILDDEFVFLFVFDFASMFERKNPLAAVKAFRSAFGVGDKARLVIKYTNAEYYAADLARMKKAAEGHNITLDGATLTREGLTSLMACCDCYVSLHRAEGFGLTIAEAMAMGKPVIATGYSGNMEFMNEANSLPVGYRVVELERSRPPYKRGGVWAEPDTDHAASLMRAVYEDRTFGERLGAQAMEDIRAGFSTEAVGGMIRRRLEALETGHSGA